MQEAPDEALVARDEALIAQHEAFIARDETLIARDETLIARDKTLIAEDEALIAQIATGDADAFSVLLSRHLDPIHAYLHRLSRSRADAEDLAQETFLKVWHKAGTYRPGRVKPSTWLHTIAHNLCIDAHRRRRDPATTTPPEPVDELADPARRASDAEQQRRLEAALAELPDNQRSAILLCQLQGFSNVQAAQILGVKVRALESLLARARRALRTELTDHGEI